MKEKVKKNIFLIIILIINAVIFCLFPETGKETFVFTGKTLLNFLFILTPIFICIGLLDVWVDKAQMIKIMGEKSGIQGIILSFLLGIVTAVPLYALLPVAGMMLKKGSKISNVLIFICSCTSIRIPLLLFEVSSLGWKYMITRLIANIVILLFIAFIIDKLLTDADKKEIYDNANEL